MSIEEIVRGYFGGEKFEAALILAAGLACLIVAIWLWVWIRQPFARGLTTSLLLVAALGLSVGGAVYLRTEGQVKHLLELRQQGAAAFAAEEGPRIRQVVKSFGLYRLCYAAAVLLAFGCVFLVGRPFCHGLAVGLLVLAALGLTIDYYAEARAVAYVRALEAAGVLPKS